VNDNSPEPGASPSVPPVGNGARRLPQTVVSWAIAGLCVLVWLAEELAGGSTSTRVLVEFGAKVNPLIEQGEYWRLITPVFIHIGLMHLAFNMVALLTIGRIGEIVFGHTRFLAIYLISGVTGVLLSYLMTRSLSAGASGAIFGIVGAMIAFGLRNRGTPGLNVRAQLQSMLWIVAVNAVWGVAQPGIDNWGHAGGLLGGLVAGAALSPKVVATRNEEGQIVALRRQPSETTSWAIVPAAVLAVAAIVALVPGR